MILNDEERYRFCQWLRQDIDSNKMLVEQMEKSAMIIAPLIKQKKMLIAAETIVLRELETVETQTIEGRTNG